LTGGGNVRARVCEYSRFESQVKRAKQDAENARMLVLHKEHVLGVKPQDKGSFVSLGNVGGIKPARIQELLKMWW